MKFALCKHNNYLLENARCNEAELEPYFRLKVSMAARARERLTHCTMQFGRTHSPLVEGVSKQHGMVLL